MKKERCPDYCPFLEKKIGHCHLFDVNLIFEDFFVKHPECANADMRKTQYKKKIKRNEERQFLWKNALKGRSYKILQTMISRWSDFKERKEFKEFLSGLAGDFPILSDKKLSKLLMNLYLTLDSSEKIQMKQLLSNPKTAKLFLDELKSMGRQPDLLKKVRKLMDDVERKQKQEEKKREEMLRRQQYVCTNGR